MPVDIEGIMVVPDSETNEPTLEQCENAAMALGLPILPKSLRPSYYEQSMRNLHAIIQKCALGDNEACAKLAILKERFGKE